MSSLSIIYSLISPESLAKIAEEAFGFSNVSCSLIKIGDNDNYLIETDGYKYILRVYKREKYWLKADSDYYFEMDWLTHLKQNNCSISYPIQRRDGEYIGHLQAPEGLRYFALFSYAVGEEDPITFHRSYLLGREVAKVHLASNNFKSTHTRLTLDIDFLIDEPVRLITNYFGSNRKSEQSQLIKLASDLKEKIARLNLENDAWGVIGGDFHGFNQHFDKQDKPTLFDFDLCGYGWRAYDLAVFSSLYR
ncbi:MAG: phosphotransferase [Gammaproteobacteria bacterium]